MWGVCGSVTANSQDGSERLGNSIKYLSSGGVEECWDLGWDDRYIGQRFRARGQQKAPGKRYPEKGPINLGHYFRPFRGA